MSYRSAEKVLPYELIELIQQYVDGDYLYIPRKESKRKKWGENTAIKQELEERNTAIFEDYIQGLSMEELAEKYFLSEKSIQRVVYQKRRGS
ncbi:MAG: hypothetical protein HDQ97_06605 [Lachnospiraceae bacterium]|nr:hypothetical protein [Lachnospiraceae bacterium]